MHEVTNQVSRRHRRDSHAKFHHATERFDRRSDVKRIPLPPPPPPPPHMFFCPKRQTVGESPRVCFNCWWKHRRKTRPQQPWNISWKPFRVKFVESTKRSTTAFSLVFFHKHCLSCRWSVSRCWTSTRRCIENTLRWTQGGFLVLIRRLLRLLRTEQTNLRWDRSGENQTWTIIGSMLWETAGLGCKHASQKTSVEKEKVISAVKRPFCGPWSCHNPGGCVWSICSMFGSCAGLVPRQRVDWSTLEQK